MLYPRSVRLTSTADTFDCWPEIAVSLILTSIALLFEDSVHVVAIGGLLAVLLFVVRRFMAGTLRILSLRTCAIIGFGGWMFLGILRYTSGMDAYVGIEEAGYAFSADVLHRLTLFTALGFTAMLIGLQMGPALLPLAGQARLARQISSRTCLVAALVFISAALPFQLQHNNFWGFVPQLPFYVGLLAPLPIPAVLLVTYIVGTDKEFSRRHALIIALLLLIGFGLIALEASRRSPLVAIIGCVFLLGWFRRTTSIQRHFWALIGSVSLALALYFAGNAIRAVSFSDKTPEGFIEQYKLLNTKAQGVQGFYMLVFVVENYPTPYPYLKGSSVVAALLNFVPRVVWPEKPIGFAKEIAFRRLGIPVDYGYSRELDKATGFQSYSGTLVGESYANFGPIGIVLMLFLFGAAAALGESYLLLNRDNQFAILSTAAALGAVLIQQRGDIVSVNFFSIHAIGAILVLLLVFGKSTPNAHSH
jgi:oligosaccharide repeat unit polymerase